MNIDARLTTTSLPKYEDVVQQGHQQQQPEALEMSEMTDFEISPPTYEQATSLFNETDESQLHSTPVSAVVTSGNLRRIIYNPQHSA
jgi:hypothetical protein